MKIILLAIRPLMRFRTYTFINVFGLALSLACVIIISRYVYSELQTDRFYPDLEPESIEESLTDVSSLLERIQQNPELRRQVVERLLIGALGAERGA